VTGLDHDRADEGGVEFKAETEVRSLLRRLENVTHERQLGCDEKVVRGIVQVALVTEKDLLPALGNYAKSRVGNAVKRLLGQGGAMEVQAFQRLNCSIFADGSCDKLD